MNEFSSWLEISLSPDLIFKRCDFTQISLTLEKFTPPSNYMYFLTWLATKLPRDAKNQEVRLCQLTFKQPDSKWLPWSIVKFLAHSKIILERLRYSLEFQKAINSIILLILMDEKYCITSGQNFFFELTPT